MIEVSRGRTRSFGLKDLAFRLLEPCPECQLLVLGAGRGVYQREIRQQVGSVLV